MSGRLHYSLAGGGRVSAFSADCAAVCEALQAAFSGCARELRLLLGQKRND